MNELLRFGSQVPVVGCLGGMEVLSGEAAAVAHLQFETAQPVLDVEPAACLPAKSALLDVGAARRQVGCVEVGAAVGRRQSTLDAQEPQGSRRSIQEGARDVHADEV